MEKLQTATALSEAIEVPDKTLADWRLRGLGPPYIRIGRHVRYRSADVERWLESRVVDRSTLTPGRPAA